MACRGAVRGRVCSGKPPRATHRSLRLASAAEEEGGEEDGARACDMDEDAATRRRRRGGDERRRAVPRLESPARGRRLSLHSNKTRSAVQAEGGASRPHHRQSAPSPLTEAISEGERSSSIECSAAPAGATLGRRRGGAFARASEEGVPSGFGSDGFATAAAARNDAGAAADGAMAARTAHKRSKTGCFLYRSHTQTLGPPLRSCA